MENTALQLLEVFSHWQATFTCGWAPGVWFYCSAPSYSEVMWRVSPCQFIKKNQRTKIFGPAIRLLNWSIFHGLPKVLPWISTTSHAKSIPHFLSGAWGFAPELCRPRFVLITVIMLKCTVSLDGLLYNVGKVLQYVQYCTIYVQCYPIHNTYTLWWTNIAMENHHF